MKTHDEILDTLARYMLQRHLQKCLDKKLRNELNEYLEGFRENERGTSRVVAIVGAGASAPVFKRGKEIAQELKREFATQPGYDEEIRRIKRVYSFDEEQEPLETALFALSRTAEGEKNVRKRLAERYKQRHPTLFTYELLAHLLKHRFLDAIISFNFDELLDQSLDDEVGVSEYTRVISERDCEGIPSPGSKESLPIYLKLHGTASEQESLRFTREAYYAMNRRLESLVRDILGTNRCILLNVGFGMRSFDFTQLLDGPAEMVIFNLSKIGFDDNALKEISDGRARKSPVDIQEVDAKMVTPAADSWPDNFTDIVLDKLGEKLDGLCKETQCVAEFRSIHRHRLITALLNWEGEKVTSPALYRHYLENRTTLEVAISAIKSRGLLSVASLADERCAKYYDHLQQEMTRSEVSRATANDWITVCSRGGLQPSEISNETFVALKKIRADSAGLGAVGEADDEAELDNLTIDVGKLCETLKKHLHIQTQRAWERFKDERVRAAFLDLQGGTEVEVHTRGDQVYSKIFRAPESLPTLTSLRARTLHMLRKRKEKEKVNRIAAVAETGAWLLTEPHLSLLKDMEDLQIYLIVAFQKDIKDLNKEFSGKNGAPKIHIMPTRWWRHNRHMTIVCRDNTPLAGIYFARRQRSLVVTPVYLDDEVDRVTLLNSFFMFWQRSWHMPVPLSSGEIPTSLEGLMPRPPESAFAESTRMLRQSCLDPGKTPE